MVIVLYGPAGSGKTTVGRELARTLGWAFHEGDAFHPPGNVDKMRSGVALEDDDRWPWLETLRRVVAQHLSEGSSAVLGCSALKRSYRKALMPEDAEPGSVRFVYLCVERAVLAERLKHRSGHFFAAALLDSQLADLEQPAPAEHVSAVDATRPVADTVTQILSDLDLKPAATASQPRDPQAGLTARR